MTNYDPGTAAQAGDFDDAGDLELAQTILAGLASRHRLDDGQVRAVAEYAARDDVSYRDVSDFAAQLGQQQAPAAPAPVQQQPARPRVVPGGAPPAQAPQTGRSYHEQARELARARMSPEQKMERYLALKREHPSESLLPEVYSSWDRTLPVRDPDHDGR